MTALGGRAVAPSATVPSTDGSPGSTRVTLRGVQHSYVRDDGQLVEALGATDLDIEPGSFVSIVGPSGCGKSTLLRLVAGFFQPSNGTIEVGGLPVSGPGPDRGVVFQQPTLYPWLTVQGNVEFGLKMQRVPRQRRREIAQANLELVGLGDAASLKPYELSGGMQQRCQLARVLATDPAVLLMDEPFGALDALTRSRLQGELLRLWRGTGRTVLFITHSVDEAVFLGSRILVMGPRPGRILDDVAAPFSTSGAGPEVRDSLEFIELRRRISAGITEPDDIPGAS